MASSTCEKRDLSTFGGTEHDNHRAQQNHRSERGRATSVSNSNATDRPRRSVLTLEMITKGNVKIACLLGVVGLVAFWFIKLAALKPAPIALAVRSYTNARAVIVVTNLGDSNVEYILKVERKIDSWPTYRQRIPVGPDSGQPGLLRPREVLTLTVPVMVYAPPYPWRVTFFCCKNAPGPNATRSKAGVWLLRLGMPGLAKKVMGEFKVVRVSGPQMEQ
jgi:hypothetical protein